MVGLRKKHLKSIDDYKTTIHAEMETTNQTQENLAKEWPNKL